MSATNPGGKIYQPELRASSAKTGVDRSAALLNKQIRIYILAAIFGAWASMFKPVCSYDLTYGFGTESHTRSGEVDDRFE